MATTIKHPCWLWDQLSIPAHWDWLVKALLLLFFPALYHLEAEKAKWTMPKWWCSVEWLGPPARATLLMFFMKLNLRLIHFFTAILPLKKWAFVSKVVLTFPFTFLISFLFYFNMVIFLKYWMFKAEQSLVTVHAWLWVVMCCGAVMRYGNVR